MMEFWTTDHGRGNFILSIRTEDESDRGLPLTPVVSQMPLRGQVVTTLGVLTEDDMYSLKDVIEEALQELNGDAF